jgi:DNA-binding NarL/FixJ family response regulator
MSHFLSNGVAPRPTAVVCDDDPMARRLVREIVERCGFDVLAGVDNAMDALSLVLDHHPVVLVLDLALNGLSGEEIISTVQESSDTQVIVHSSFDPRKAVKSGARLFASKGNIKQLEKLLLKVRDAAQVSA